MTKNKKMENNYKKLKHEEEQEEGGKMIWRSISLD